jgi:D-3-phosphoglycerate dehydrogenase
MSIRKGGALMTKILIVGDKFFEPLFFKDYLEKNLSKEYDIEIETMKFDFPVESFILNDNTVVPSGMSWDDPNIPKPEVGIREFYGDPFALKDVIRNVNVLIIHGAALSKEVLENANALKVVITLRGGPENVDRAYAEQRGIKFYNTPGKNAQAVAEYTIGLLLSFLRNIPESSYYLKKGVWKPSYYEYDRTGIEINGKTFGLVGMGGIGCRVAKILKGFDANIIAYDPFVEQKRFEEIGVKRVELDELVSQSDFISIHARQPKNAKPIIGERKIKMMKKNAVLINTARGNLFDYKALKSALENRQIRGAVLDVFGPEEFSFYKELFSLPNVLATPHIAGGSQETVKRAMDMTVAILKEFLEKQRK